MMYNNKLAIALKSNGKVLREFGETVYVPFGSEYSVLIKNLNSVRALVTVTVDGTDAGDGTEFVVNANDSIELERFIKNGNLKKGNCFKFIERTDNIENHRGVGIEDGIVRVEFRFEKKIAYDYNDMFRWNLERGCCGSPQVTWTADGIDHSVLRNMNVTCSTASAEHVQVNYSAEVKSLNDAGITVPGSVSDQSFRTVSSFPVEDETHVIVLQMLGETENKKIVKPVTVKAKPKCETCGKVNKATAKFCSECGTSLTII